MDLKDILKSLGVPTVCPKCGHDLLGASPVKEDSSPIVEPPKPQEKPTKVFTQRIVFEKSSDEGYGDTAIILFPTLADAEISKVILNGEVAAKSKPYNGHPVFKMSKVGDKYLPKLKFEITYNGGAYTAEQVVASEPTAPSGTKSETVKNSGQANGNRSHFRFRNKVAVYGDFSFSFDGGKVYNVTREQVADGRYEPGGGILVKSPDNRGGTAILGEHNKVYKICTIKW
jgi:hypothetical protein